MALAIDESIDLVPQPGIGPGLLEVDVLAAMTDRSAGLMRSHADDVTSLIRAFVSHHPQSAYHCFQVCEWAARVGRRAGIAAPQLRRLTLGAIFHDIGKLAVPSEVLAKRGRLEPAEYQLVRFHAVAGAELLAGDAALQIAASCARWHHERPDGGGYPDGLTKDAIPFEVSIISVCDAWDAMTSPRPYRDASAPAAVLAILHDGAGTQWDRRVVHLLTAEVTSGRLAPRWSPPAGAGHGQPTGTDFSLAGGVEQRPPGVVDAGPRSQPIAPPEALVDDRSGSHRWGRRAGRTRVVRATDS